MHTLEKTGTRSQEMPTLALAPNVLVDSTVTSWTRFITTSEASEFTDWIDESVSWKTTCYIGDWSPLLKIRVRGRESRKQGFFRVSVDQPLAEL